ncbi:YciI family protein [Mesorhizobium sp. M0898]|uniref:YciI family protein n=1 Tax=Mesorhizobium sp. M0898 TaxID=2957020 RepID=UPI00333982F7
MKYVCLVYGEEKDLYAMTPERLAKLDADSMAHDRSLDQRGMLIIAQALQSVKTSKTVRRRKGKSLDEALGIAGEIPLAEIGTIEVRAIYKVPGS